MDEELLNDMVEQEEFRKEMGYSYPVSDEKTDVVSFIKDVVRNTINIKTAFVSSEELGLTRTPVRTNLDIANYCNMMGMPNFSRVFVDDAQVTLATSLSREGFLNKLAVTQKKESETKFQKGEMPQQNKKKSKLDKYRDTYS